MSTTTHEQANDSDARTADGHAEMEAVRALMDERRRFERWLETLETRREATPQRVYERVRGDYETRLDAVIAELRGHTAMLRTTLADLNERAQALRAEEETRREERAEGELRAAVGEYSSEHWATLAAAADADIERLCNDRGALTADLARVQEMLAHTEAPRTPPAGQQVVAAAAAAPVAAEVAPVAAEPVHAEPAIEHAAPNDESSLRALYGEETDAAMQPIDSLQFDAEPEPEPEPEPVVESVAPLAPVAATPAPVAPPAPERRSPAAGTPAVDLLGGAMAFDELAFLKSVVGPRSGGSPAADASAPRSGPAAAVQDRVGARREGSSTPGYAEAAKTLRCGECGTMNAPTEWYCERCGGELAAL